jgi:surfeit locus 1 family protein
MATSVRAARRFRPGLWPSLVALAGVLVLLGLGTWQVERMDWKERLIAERQARLAAPPEPLPSDAEDWRPLDFRRVQASGVLRHDLEQLFGAFAIEGRVGHHVLTPLIRPHGAAVLVDRGWVPADKAHPAAHRAGQVEGEARITGIARYRENDRPGWFRPDNQPGSGLWFWYDLPALKNALGLELLPVVIEADAGASPGDLPIAGQTRIELPNNHLQYAITWYGLAAALAAVYVAFGLRRPEERG